MSRGVVGVGRAWSEQQLQGDFPQAEEIVDIGWLQGQTNGKNK